MEGKTTRHTSLPSYSISPIPHLLRRTPGHLLPNARVRPRQDGAPVAGAGRPVDGRVERVERHRHGGAAGNDALADVEHVRFGAVVGAGGQLVQGDGGFELGHGGGLRGNVGWLAGEHYGCGGCCPPPPFPFLGPGQHSSYLQAQQPQGSHRAAEGGVHRLFRGG